MILGWCPARGSRRDLATWAAFAYKMPLVAHVGKLCHGLLSCLTLIPTQHPSDGEGRSWQFLFRHDAQRPSLPSLLPTSIPFSQVAQVSMSVAYSHLSVG